MDIKKFFGVPRELSKMTDKELSAIKFICENELMDRDRDLWLVKRLEAENQILEPPEHHIFQG